MSYVRTLTICLLLVYFVRAAGCHCFDLRCVNLNTEAYFPRPGFWSFFEVSVFFLLDRGYGLCQVKRYSLRSQQSCQHILCVEQSEGAFAWMFRALGCVALCVIAKYKTTLYKFNWLKDKLPCLD